MAVLAAVVVVVVVVTAVVAAGALGHGAPPVGGVRTQTLDTEIRAASLPRFAELPLVLPRGSLQKGHSFTLLGGRGRRGDHQRAAVVAAAAVLAVVTNALLSSACHGNDEPLSTLNPPTAFSLSHGCDHTARK